MCSIQRWTISTKYSFKYFRTMSRIHKKTRHVPSKLGLKNYQTHTLYHFNGCKTIKKKNQQYCNVHKCFYNYILYLIIKFSFFVLLFYHKCNTFVVEAEMYNFTINKKKKNNIFLIHTLRTWKNKFYCVRCNRITVVKIIIIIICFWIFNLTVTQINSYL